MPDDYSATTQTSGAVTVGGSTRGNIETGGDIDWFAVTLFRKQRVKLAVACI